MPAENEFLLELDKRVRTARDSVSRSEGLGLRAIHDARKGRIDSSRAIISSMRTDPRNKETPQAVCWQKLAEGVIASAECDYGKAMSLFQQSYSTALDCEYRRILPSCAAWMADAAFSMAQVDVMTNRLDEVFTTAPKDDHHARARANQTMAVSMFYADSHQNAKVWYQRSHQHATAEKDQAAISSLFYNTTAFRLFRMRLRDAFDQAQDDSIETLVSEEDFHRFYDFATGNSIQLSSAKLTRGQIRMLLGDYEEASNILSTIPKTSLRISEIPVLLADLARTKSKLGAVNEATWLIDESLRLAGNLSDEDDHAYVRARGAQVTKEAGHTSRSIELSRAAHHHMSRVQSTFDYWVKQMEPLVSSYVDPKLRQ